MISKIIPSELHIVICAVVASAVLAIVKPVKTDRADDKESEDTK